MQSVSDALREHAVMYVAALKHVLAQAELAQEEAQQLQGAGHFAEAAALSSAAHKWRKKSARVFRITNSPILFPSCLHVLEVQDCESGESA